jgi:glycerol uptake facilitator-like aquaporin
MNHQIRIKTGEFDAKRMGEKERDRYLKLEKQGYVVSSESLKRLVPVLLTIHIAHAHLAPAVALVLCWVYPFASSRVPSLF